MKQLHRTGALIRFLVAISTLYAFAVTEEYQFSFDRQNGYEQDCKWHFSGSVSYTSSCVCRYGNTSPGSFLQNSLPSKSECIGKCLSSLEGYVCDRNFPMHYIMENCCIQCGGAHKTSLSLGTVSCFEKPARTTSPTPSYTTNLSAVNSSRSPDYNGLVLQRNTQAILGNGLSRKALIALLVSLELPSSPTSRSSIIIPDRINPLLVYMKGRL